MKKIKKFFTKEKKFKKCLSLIACLAFIVSAAVMPFGVSATDVLLVSGSTTIYPYSIDLEPAFEADYPGTDVQISGGGSSTGFRNVRDGISDVGNMSRDLKTSEKTDYPNIIATTIGKDAIAVIVNNSNALNGLTGDQVYDVFSSASTAPITDWSQLGQPAGTINVHIRDENSGTGEAFKSLALNKTEPVAYATEHASNQALLAAVAADPVGIGYVSLGVLDSTAKGLTIDGVAATPANAVNGSYPYVRPLNVVTKREPIGLAEKWLFYHLGPAGQQKLEDDGYIRINDSNLDVKADSSVSGLLTVAQSVASNLSTVAGLPITATSDTDSNIITQVQNETIEVGIIGRTLTAAEINAGLSQKLVGKKANFDNIYAITLGEYIGASQLYIRYLRNPKGQNLFTDNGLVRAWIFGDTSGDDFVDVADYTLMRQKLILIIKEFPSEFWLYTADPSGDHNIDAADYTLMRQKLLLMISNFPAETSYAPYY